jgi:hypothetical protein
LHRTIACFDCHKNGNFAGLSPNCAACHHDDAQRTGTGTYGGHLTTPTCANCHNPNSWLGAVDPVQNMGKPSPAQFGRESVCR